MSKPLNIIAAGNVEVPAYLTLLAKGYKVRCVWRGEQDYWVAEGELGCFGGESPIELLGVVIVAETRGAFWKATDAETESFMTKFKQSSGE